MTNESSALTAIKAASPTFKESVVADAVKDQFGLQGGYSMLVSERDQNFRLRTADGTQFLVKVTSAVEDAATTDFQIGALQHVEKAGGILVPGIVKTVDGNASGNLVGDDMTCRLRVLTWINGEQLETLGVDLDRARQFGSALARLDLALQSYSHPGENPALLWDLQRAGELRGIFAAIVNQSARDAATAAIDDFDNNVVPALSSLRKQVIHADANPENVLVTDSGLGFIDFGDAIRAPLVFDVAIAASYLREYDGDPTTFIGPFVAGYHSVLPLTDVESGLLFDLIRARLATTITLLYWRLRARVEDDPYRQKALDLEGGAGNFLAALDALGRREFNNKINKLCD